MTNNTYRTDYAFYLNETLCCEKNGQDSILENNKATELLRRFDQFPIQHIHVTSRNIEIKTSHRSYTLVNYSEILNSKFSYCLRNTEARIHQEISKAQRKKYRNAAVKNLALAGTAVVGMLAITTLTGMARANAKEQELATSVTPIESVPLNIEPEIGEINSIETISEEIVPIEQIIVEDANTEYQLDDTSYAEYTYLDFNNERYSITGEYTYNLYYDMAEPRITKWGIPANLGVAMMTQETAGQDKNLMQIQFDVWKEKPDKPLPIITVYNYNTNQYEKFLLTDHPENHVGKDITCITRQDLENPKTNISVAMILLRQSIAYMNGHIAAGIQCYNFGSGNMDDVLKATSEATGLTRDEILSDQQNLSFMNYTYVVDEGDPEYLNHVLRYMENLEEGITIKSVSSTGEITENTVYIAPISHQK